MKVNEGESENVGVKQKVTDIPSKSSGKEAYFLVLTLSTLPLDPRLTVFQQHTDLTHITTPKKKVAGAEKKRKKVHTPSDGVVACQRGALYCFPSPTPRRTILEEISQTGSQLQNLTSTFTYIISGSSFLCTFFSFFFRHSHQSQFINTFVIIKVNLILCPFFKFQNLLTRIFFNQNNFQITKFNNIKGCS